MYQNKEGIAFHLWVLCILIYIKTKKAELFTCKCCVFWYISERRGWSLSPVSVVYFDMYQNKEGRAYHQWVLCILVYQNKEGRAFHRWVLCILIYIKTKKEELFICECCVFWYISKQRRWSFTPVRVVCLDIYQNEEGRAFHQWVLSFFISKQRGQKLFTSECYILWYQNKEDGTRNQWVLYIFISKQRGHSFSPVSLVRNFSPVSVNTLLSKQYERVEFSLMSVTYFVIKTEGEAFHQWVLYIFTSKQRGRSFSQSVLHTLISKQH